MKSDNFKPKLNDYVKWKNEEGWIYFVDEEYISIELGTKYKSKESFDNTRTRLHKKHHILLVCPSWCWDELEYVRKRISKYHKDTPDTGTKALDKD